MSDDTPTVEKPAESAQPAPAVVAQLKPNRTPGKVFLRV